jgi:hypothetical protein
MKVGIVCANQHSAKAINHTLTRRYIGHGVGSLISFLSLVNLHQDKKLK